MPFPMHTLDTAPAGSRETLEHFLRSYGFLPNLAAALAESPAALKGYVAMTGVFDSEEMTLSALERQALLLAVSAKNRCAYCTAAHGMLAGKQGLPRSEVDKLTQGQRSGDARLEALRCFADRIVAVRGHVSDGELADFIAAGFTQAQALEVIFGVAVKMLTNYAHHLAKPPVNEQFAGFLPQWADA